jgi:hypothetical protein
VINFVTDRQRKDLSKKVEPTNGEFLKAIQGNNPKMWPDNFSGVKPKLKFIYRKENSVKDQYMNDDLEVKDAPFLGNGSFSAQEFDARVKKFIQDLCEKVSDGRVYLGKAGSKKPESHYKLFSSEVVSVTSFKTAVKSLNRKAPLRDISKLANGNKRIDEYLRRDWKAKNKKIDDNMKCRSVNGNMSILNFCKAKS